MVGVEVPQYQLEARTTVIGNHIAYYKFHKHAYDALIDYCCGMTGYRKRGG
jgi:hypothetical protein